MTTQLSLFTGATLTPRERFCHFHEAHPEVYRLLVRFTQEAVAAGRTRIGIRMIWERMRWTQWIERRLSDEEFKLNDHYTPFYARLMMAEEPGLADIFETRTR